jgi:hypothetical protein
MSTFPRNPQGKNPMFHNVRDPNVHNNYDGAKLQRLHSDNIHPHQQRYIDIPRVPFDSQDPTKKNQSAFDAIQPCLLDHGKKVHQFRCTVHLD